ncbi:putative tail protein [Blastomonas natatoria]|uniref:Putative tail protein n=1 Tax=Blastomonas natatoria TaxID=34015 RepID=A0A2V3VDL7_9SPHN|nr:phage tail protein [Blastomonas natatoria]PXW78145.1 putative tail protein [Blastomonas natatoria]
MATLVLSAVGTLVGGPLGGALGALLGRTVDQTLLFRPRDREGPRLVDLAVQSSQYGSAFAHVHGRARIAGTVIWATDLKERRIREGGGKGRPGTTRYSYSVSFAVALSARPIASVGRIWAEGNLLRGADGVFTSETDFRLHDGHGDQSVDPLIAAAEGVGQCPAYRGLAYAVFEDMALEEFGNRIPSLTFEVIGTDGEVQLNRLMAELVDALPSPRGDQAVAGWSLTGDTRRDAIQAIAAGFPVALSEEDGFLRTAWREAAAGPDMTITNRMLLPREQEAIGFLERRRSVRATGALALRYYEPERDYQPGLRRAGASSDGRVEHIDVPAVMTAGRAQQRVNELLRLDRDGRERIRLRLALFDMDLLPGKVVAIEGMAGEWLVRRWQWGAEGVDLELESRGKASGASTEVSDPGRSISSPDGPIGETRLAIFDLPSPMDRPMSHPHIGIAAAGRQPGWRGAHVYEADDAALPGEILDFLRIGATLGDVVVGPGPGSSLIRDDLNTITVELVRDGPFVLANADDDALSRGANMAMVGRELLQFARAEPMGDRTFRLSGLWRGRGGTEDAISAHGTDESFVLVNDALVLVDPDRVSARPDFQALAQGRGDAVPVHAGLTDIGRAMRPLAPVHPVCDVDADGSVTLRWVRRSRSGFAWRDQVEVPLDEAFEAYRVIILADGTEVAAIEVAAPSLAIDTVTMAHFRSAATVSLDALIVQRGALGVSSAVTVPLPR